MNQTGPISLYFHLMVNFYYNVLKKYPNRVLPLVIIFSLASVLVLNGRSAVVNNWKDNNVKVLGEMTYVCKPVKQVDSEKKIILRLDDVQAFAYTEMTKNMITDAVKRNMKMVIGVIPYNFSEDRTIDRFLEKNQCNLELALHGWDHSMNEEARIFEFEEMGSDDAQSKIKEGKRILEEIGGMPAVTFIPPGNEISDETKDVLGQEGFKYLSGDSESSEFGMDATTFDFVEGKIIGNGEVLERCEERFKKNKFCVIVLHPQDYMTNEEIDLEKYSQYVGLLDELRNREVYSTTFRDL